MRLNGISKLRHFAAALMVLGATAGCGSSALTDGKIFGILKTANDGEIKASQRAQEHAQGTSAKDYASMVNSMHTDANARQTKLATDQGITPVTSTDNTSLQSANDAVYAKLVAAPDSAFDSEYITQMIESHQKVLDLLDNDMIPAAHNASLKTELATTKAAVTDHLNKAKAIKAQ